MSHHVWHNNHTLSWWNVIGCNSCLVNNNNSNNSNNNSNTYDDIYGAVSVAQSHCESSPSSLDRCTLSTRWLPTLSQAKQLGCYCAHPPSPFYYYSTKADTHFTALRRVEGWVNLDTVVKVHSPCPKLYIAAAVMRNTTASGQIRTCVLSCCSRTC